jgi:hypothetical protein
LLFTLAEPPTGEYILGGHDAIFYQQGKNWKNKKKLEETYELPRHCAHLCIYLVYVRDDGSRISLVL